MAMTRDCKSLAFGLRRFESYFQHQFQALGPVFRVFAGVEIDNFRKVCYNERIGRFWAVFCS